MKEALKQKFAKCGMKINSDDKVFDITLSVFKNDDVVQTNFKMPKRCTDKNKIDVIESMKKWYMKNKSNDKCCDPEYFMEILYKELKVLFRIREWKTIGQLEEEKKSYYKSIDRLTEYIDNYRQQKEAEQNNKKIKEMIELYDRVIIKMKDIAKTHPDVQYSFGLYRYKENNEYKFIKFEK